MFASLASSNFAFRVSANDFKALADVFESEGFMHILDLEGADEEFLDAQPLLDGRLRGLAMNIIKHATSNPCSYCARACSAVSHVRSFRWPGRCSANNV